MMKKRTEPQKHRAASILTLSFTAVVFIAMVMLTAGCSGGSGQTAEPLPPDNFGDCP